MFDYIWNLLFKWCFIGFEIKLKPKSHSFCKNSANESWGEGVELAAAWLSSLDEFGNLDWKEEVPDICPVDLYSCPFPPKPDTAPEEYSAEIGWWDWTTCWEWAPSSSTGLSESELLPPRLPHLEYDVVTR